MSDVPETRNGPGWVIMTHPELKGSDGGPAYAEVTQEALDGPWAEKGWVKAEPTTRSTKSTKVSG